MRVLFIGLDYQEYTSELVKELQLLGYTVDFYSLKPRRLFEKYLMVLSPVLYGKYLKKWHRKIYKETFARDYDKVLFLQVHLMELRTLELFKRNHHNSEFILYNWDSIKTHDYSSYVHLFDRVLTFDREDADFLGFRYLPLFATREYQAKEGVDFKYDIYFIGNVVSERRLRAILEFRAWCKENRIVYKFHLKCSPVMRVRFAFKGYLKFYGFKFYNLNLAQCRSIVMKSKCVFDFANHVQSGYTMRLVENMVAGKRIITNNNRVLEEDWYDQNQFYVLGNDTRDLSSFILRDTIGNSGESVFDEFFIQNFVKELINGK